MFRRIILTTVLCFGLMAFLGTQQASAFGGWPQPTGWGWAPPNSITCKSDWKSIGNTYQYDSEIKCEIEIEQVEVTCANNGDNTGGIGVPFDVSVSALGIQLLTPEDVYAKGKYESKILFESQYMFDLIFCVKDNDGCVEALDETNAEICRVYNADTGECDYWQYVYDVPVELCQNHNWYVLQPIDGGEFLVVKGKADISAWVDGVEKTYLTGECTYNFDAGLYDCTTNEVVKIK